jgi:hypothetical protein
MLSAYIKIIQEAHSLLELAEQGIHIVVVR